MKAKVLSLISIAFLFGARPGWLSAREAVAASQAKASAADDTPADVLSPDEWRRIDGAVERALTWLEEFFPSSVRTVLANQQPDGSWPAESHFNDRRSYATALVVLPLGAPNQFLPIFHR
jgi:hypothetical protein